MTVWDTLVGPEQVAITALQAATSGQGMTHAAFGPPGSGRSNLALVFAAALQCERPGGVAAGCGECHACHTVMVKTHADVRLVATQQLTIGVDDVRELVRRAALTPVGSGWQIIIIEDADRLTDQASNALLKAIEEPSERTVWTLGALTAEDMPPTIRSRCRMVESSTPHARDVEAFLIAQGADRQRAHTAARAAQGHIGRARALATDDETMQRRRHSVVTLPFGLTSLGAAMSAAETVNEAAKAEAKAFTDEADERGEDRPRVGVRRRAGRPSAARVRPGARGTGARPEEARDPAGARCRGSRPDGSRVGLSWPRAADRGCKRCRVGQRGPAPPGPGPGRCRLCGGQPGADRDDLRGSRTTAGVQRAAVACVGVDDGGVVARRHGSEVMESTKRRWLVPVLVTMMVLALIGVGIAITYEASKPIAQPTFPTRSPSATSSAAVEPPEPELAEFYGQSLDWEGCRSAYECASLTVPVDYADPTGETVEIALLRVRAQGTPIGSLVVNPGGPGAPGTSYAAAAEQVFRPALLESYDIVGFDPRGTGRAARSTASPTGRSMTISRVIPTPMMPRRRPSSSIRCVTSARVVWTTPVT